MNLLEIQNASFLPEAIKQLDYNLFYRMNGLWHNSFFDVFFPFIREPTLWVPFYFFLIVFATLNFKVKGWIWVVFFLANAGISDYVSSHLIKENFFRLRPCRDPALFDHIRFLVSYCPVSSSFTSSHAVNHFAAAMFIFTTFRKTLSSFWALMFIWAGAISYAQVYVGVHFPFDVFCGMIAGLILGYIPATIFNRKFGLELPH
ncbi:phosphatase PAP2 family protein [Hanamia caeni]|jgi:undecaprenyl-diphosphatase|uniref:Phosphatase PAP2 family protein n=1 Tax=Hanamia caeni TaxID=2294116 RepID=A0A3M9NQR3_9BACT|nr:phosphatase PAP2 family protein [Hanamia caeni]RNI40060.1 phosphatase PAP2 family protein [Hanamia caeni]